MAKEAKILTKKVLADEIAAKQGLTKKAAAEEAATNATTLINGLPAADALTLNDKTAVQAASDAYDALSDLAKSKIAAETLAALEAAKAKILELEAADAAAEADAVSVIALINALPAVDALTLDNKDQVQAAAAAYDALGDAAKAKVPADAKSTLDSVRARMTELIEEDEEASQQAQQEADNVAAAITALPSVGNLTLDDKDKVDPTKLNALIFDQFRHGYYVSGEQVGKAWNAGAALMKK